MQPVPKVSDADVERVIQRDFTSSEASKVRAALAAYGSDSQAGAARVRLAALKLSRGSLEELREQIEAAKIDCRDVLAAAEYPRASREWQRLAEASEAYRREVYDDDWRQYEAWLNPPPQ